MNPFLEHGKATVTPKPRSRGDEPSPSTIEASKMLKTPLTRG